MPALLPEHVVRYIMPLDKNTIYDGLPNPEWRKSFLQNYCQHVLRTKTAIRADFANIGPDIGQRGDNEDNERGIVLVTIEPSITKAGQKIGLFDTGQFELIQHAENANPLEQGFGTWWVAFLPFPVEAETFLAHKEDIVEAIHRIGAAHENAANDSGG